MVYFPALINKIYFYFLIRLMLCVFLKIRHLIKIAVCIALNLNVPDTGARCVKHFPVLAGHGSAP